MADDKPILEYADGRPTAAQNRRKWLLVTGLVGGGLAAGFVGWAVLSVTPSEPGFVVSPPLMTGTATQPSTAPSADSPTPE